MSEGQLAGQTAIVTGAGTGIGEAIAMRYAAEGATVVITGRRAALLEEVAGKISATGGRVFAVPADVGEEAAVTALFQSTIDRCGAVDILVNNAGVAGPIAPIWEQDLAGWEATLRTNLTGPWLCARAAARAMIPRRRGKIVNIGSISGKRPLARRTPYTTTKLGLVGLTRTLALELGEYNINVNNISPALVETPRVQELADAAGVTAEALKSQMGSITALKRISEPDDVANLALFLVTDAARNITGFDINVDAGLWYS
jgi:NAD(P)-dependent dehydrogenase (short-subunit alcohol dehydrogenase family)